MARRPKDLMDAVAAELSNKPFDQKISNRRFVADEFERLDSLLGPGKHTVNTVAATITSQGRKISRSTLEQYMNAERKLRAEGKTSPAAQEPLRPNMSAALSPHLPQTRRENSGEPTTKKFKTPRPE